MQVAVPHVRNDEPFLGVERSLRGKRWRLRLADERAGLALAQRLEVPEIVGRVLAARGVGLDEAEGFLNPTLRSLLPDPSHLLDMDAAAERLARAVMGGEAVAVFGDYDVDGATSAALLQRFLTAVGAPARVYIPDRLREGYGPNAAALLALKAEGARVVVTVDCGTSAHGPLEEAAVAGLDVIVVDHHEAEARLPRAWAVVNPNRLDEASPHKQLAAVGVAFLLVVAVNRRLREAGWYGEAGGRAEPDPRTWLDLVALGTICDVVPLTGVNRALVAQGLKVMARRGNVGLAALADAAALEARPGTYHVGFVLGPRVNAGGRVGRSDLGVRLLATEDADEARAIARELDAHNTERRRLDAAVLVEALAQVEARPGKPGPLVFAAGEGWHPGVIGIVAGRLKDRYNRPACVVALDGGTGKGSLRSVSGIDIGAAVIAARQSGLLLNGGGHAMAAGLTVTESGIEPLREFLAERIAGQAGVAPVIPSLGLDGALSPEAATPELVELLERVGPFGAGNAEPRFAFARMRVVKADVVGADHVRCVLADQARGRLRGIAFRSLDTDLGQGLLASGGAPLHVAGRLAADNWQGRTRVQLLIDDAVPVSAA
ncbi:MAG: single-stranded-DNA-specific exonuclease RecJ [Alphaproteobacteria bacterium]